MSISYTDYFFTFSVTPQPLNALRQLSENTKDLITPVVLLAPWLSTCPLSNTLVKFEEAFPDRPYFLDIDRKHQSSSNTNEAHVEHRNLLRNPSILLNMALEREYACPCFNVSEYTFEHLMQVIKQSRMRGRSFCVKLEFLDELTAMPSWLIKLLSRSDMAEANDWLLLIEYGWLPDAMFAQSHATILMDSLSPILKPTVPIVISCTTFPRSFTPFNVYQKNHDESQRDSPAPESLSREQIESLPFHQLEPVAKAFNNRLLISELKQRTNHPKLIYGDWGSTRPRKSGIAAAPRTRVDYPTAEHWIIARFQYADLDFSTASRIITNSSHWDGSLGCWGENLIYASSEGLSEAISTMPQMNAARINIHLHRQANFADLPRGAALDEIWED